MNDGLRFLAKKLSGRFPSYLAKMNKNLHSSSVYQGICGILTYYIIPGRLQTATTEYKMWTCETFYCSKYTYAFYISVPRYSSFFCFVQLKCLLFVG